MPVTRTETVTRYEYAELTAVAKETAREWWRGCLDSSDYESTVEDFAECVALLGVELDSRSSRTMGGGTRSDPDVRWSLSYSQGDGASYSGSYAYRKGAVAAIKKHTGGSDAELIRIATELQAVQKKFLYGLTAKMSDGNGSNFYSHSGTMSVDVETRDGHYPGNHVDDVVTRLLRDLGDWLYQRLIEQDTYLSSDEYVVDAMEANGYTFDEGGNRKD